MRYAVLGSNGFLGSHLVDDLLKKPGNEVLGISRSPEKSALYLPYMGSDRTNFTFCQWDICVTETLVMLLDDFRPDYVINYAAETDAQRHVTPVHCFETNTMAVVMLCDELRHRDYLRRYVQVSSAAVYGPSDMPLDESACRRPTTFYAASKLAADCYLLLTFRHHGFPATIIRLPYVYGKHQQLHKLIPRAIVRLLEGKKVELHNGGSVVRPFVHVRDVCKGILAAIQRGRPGEIYHLSTFILQSIGWAVEMICRKMGRDFEESTVSVEGRGDDPCYWLDYSKAITELSWIPTIRFGDGVAEVIAWIRSNWDQIKREADI